MRVEVTIKEGIDGILLKHLARWQRLKSRLESMSCPRCAESGPPLTRARTVDSGLSEMTSEPRLFSDLFRASWPELDSCPIWHLASWRLRLLQPVFPTGRQLLAGAPSAARSGKSIEPMRMAAIPIALRAPSTFTSTTTLKVLILSPVYYQYSGKALV